MFQSKYKTANRLLILTPYLQTHCSTVNSFLVNCDRVVLNLASLLHLLGWFVQFRLFIWKFLYDKIPYYVSLFFVFLFVFKTTMTAAVTAGQGTSTCFNKC